MCFFDKKPATPSAPTVDPEAERRASEAAAATKANEQALADARRKRQQKGVLATDGETSAGSVLASGAAPAATSNASTVLGSGGA